MQESPGLKPDCSGDPELFFEKKVKHLMIKESFKYFTTNR